MTLSAVEIGKHRIFVCLSRHQYTQNIYQRLLDSTIVMKYITIICLVMHSYDIDCLHGDFLPD